MARFITVHQRQATVQTQSSFIHYLLLTIIVMEIIPLPHIPLLDFEPLNLAMVVAVMMMLFNLKQLPKIHNTSIKAILLILFFCSYEYVLDLALDSEYKLPISTFRTVVELTLFSVACTNLKELKHIFMAVTIGLFISMMIGVLIYHFGEPFQSIRDWLLQDTTVVGGKSGKGLWISGLSGYHFLFGYVVATMPVLALIGSQLSRSKWLWYLIFILSFYAVYLNTERAAVLGALSGVVFLTIRWKLLNPIFIFVAITFFIAFYILKSNPLISNINATGFGKESLATRFARQDSMERLHWLKSGINSVLKHPLTGVNHQQYLESIFNRPLNVINSPDRKSPYAHNHYVNIGLRIGILGWVLMIMYLWKIKTIIKKLFEATIKDKQKKVLFEGISLALIAPMIVALFHNGGIFFNEPATVCLTGLLFASYQISDAKNLKIRH